MIAEKMRKAGYVSTSERLRAMAQQAAADTGNHAKAAASLLWARLSEGAAPELVELIGQERGERLCAEFLHETVGMARQRVPQNDGGDGATSKVPEGRIVAAPPAVAETPARAASGEEAIAVLPQGQKKPASPAGSPRSIHVSDHLEISETGASPGGSGQCGPDTQKEHAAPAKPNRVGAIGLAAISNLTRRSLLDTFKVNGQPIGDMERQELEGWVISHERDARFARLIVELMPPKGRVRDYVTNQQASELYRLAEDAANAG
jgi:hypothetical protein